MGMKKILLALFLLGTFSLPAFADLASQAGGNLKLENNSPDWEVAMRGTSSVRAFYPQDNVEVTIDISNILPSSSWCLSNDRITDIKVPFSIYKVAQRGEKDWAKSVDGTRVTFYYKGKSEERRIYGSNLIDDNRTFSEGSVVNVGTLTFLSPFVCKQIDGLRIRMHGMKARYRTLPPLDFEITVAE